MRAFAAFLIIYYHSYHLLYPRLVLGRPWAGGTEWVFTKHFLLGALIEGHSAVSLFLVVSGFILTYGALGKDFSPLEFWRNRALRVLPLFLFILMIGVYANTSKFHLSAFLQTVLQLGFLPGGLELGPWNGVIWTVSVEVQLYLVFPLVQHLLNQQRPWAIIRMLVLAMLCRMAAMALGSNILDLTYWTTLARVDQFLVGALTAYWLSKDKPPHWLKWLFPVSILLVISALYGLHRSGGLMHPQPWRVLWPLIEGVIWAFLLACYLQVAPLLSSLLSRVLQFLGKISYSLYLTHLVVLWIFLEKGWYWRGGLGMTPLILLNTSFVFLPVIIAISWLSYSTIEKPFLELRRRYVLPPESADRAQRAVMIS